MTSLFMALPGGAAAPHADANLDTTHPHHAKLREIQLQTAETRDLQILATAFALGVLTGEQFEAAQDLLRGKVAALLERRTRS